MSDMFEQKATQKLRGFFRTDAACAQVVTMLSAFRSMQLSLLGKHEEASKFVPQVVFNLALAQYDNPFFQAHGARILPAFQAGVIAWLDAGRYLEKLDKEKGPDEGMPRNKTQIKLIENAQAVSKVYREFVIAAAIADAGDAQRVLMASRDIRDALDDLMGDSDG